MAADLITPPPLETEKLAQSLSMVMQARQTVLPKRLIAPGPKASALHIWLECATTAPDHDRLRPWRLIYIPDAQRPALAQAFADALRERDAMATPEQLEQARDKALRAPVLLILVVNSQVGDASIDMNERVLSAGCAVQNLLLMATAKGWGSALTSGKAMKSHALRQLLSLGTDDYAICCLSVGTINEQKNRSIRPALMAVVQTLTAQGVVQGLTSAENCS